jgi:hypothetical protein
MGTDSGHRILLNFIERRDQMVCNDGEHTSPYMTTEWRKRCRPLVSTFIEFLSYGDTKKATIIVSM